MRPGDRRCAQFICQVVYALNSHGCAHHRTRRTDGVGARRSAGSPLPKAQLPRPQRSEIEGAELRPFMAHGRDHIAPSKILVMAAVKPGDNQPRGVVGRQVQAGERFLTKPVHLTLMADTVRSAKIMPVASLPDRSADHRVCLRRAARTLRDPGARTPAFSSAPCQQSQRPAKASRLARGEEMRLLRALHRRRRRRRTRPPVAQLTAGCRRQPGCLASASPFLVPFVRR